MDGRKNFIAWRCPRKAFARLCHFSLTQAERFSVVATTTQAFVRIRIVRPTLVWLLGHMPTWMVVSRLQNRSHGWYRVPSTSAAELVRLRFCIWPIEVGDHVRLQNGRLAAVGYATPNFTEIIFVLPNGELEPDPRSSEMTRAWAAYNAARR
jgi:hypothetical protein